MTLPILYSFRRCPYAMRARLAICATGLKCELREIVLRDKAPEFLAASPKATVPVVVIEQGQVIEESLEVMLWALDQSDPLDWLSPQNGDRGSMMSLIAQGDGDFKENLDRYKYASRFENGEGEVARDRAVGFLHTLNSQLAPTGYLFGSRNCLADIAIGPFVRQFANVNRPWFDTQDWPHLHNWLARFIESPEFAAIMGKYVKWQAGAQPIFFPESVQNAS